jgi:L-fuculose-phosphate aldolase
VASALGPHKAVLLRNHGVAVVGASIEEATVLALLLEEACQIQLLAQAGGGVGEVFSDDSIQRLHHNITRPEQYTINFDYLRRRAERAAGAGR